MDTFMYFNSTKYVIRNAETLKYTKIKLVPVTNYYQHTITVIAVSLHSTATKITQITTKKRVNDLLITTRRYNKNEIKNNNDPRMSALPTKAATLSVWIGCTVNSRAPKYADFLYLVFRRSTWKVGSTSKHKATYNTMFKKWNWNAFSVEFEKIILSLKKSVVLIKYAKIHIPILFYIYLYDKIVTGL